MRVSYEIWLERGNLSSAFVVEIFSFRTFLAIVCPWTKTRWPYRSHCFMDCRSIWLTSSQKKKIIIIIPVFEVPLNFTFRFCSLSHIFSRWTLMDRAVPHTVTPALCIKQWTWQRRSRGRRQMGPPGSSSCRFIPYRPKLQDEKAEQL